jgi:hypothetical protein
MTTTTNNTTPNATWLIAAALAPCLLAAWFTTRAAEMPALTITKDRPALLFGTYLYHHGDEPVSVDSVLESEFRFRNDGTEPVTIGTITRSCGCMAPRLSDTQIAPGEQGSIFVPIQTINQSPGPHEYTLTVEYSDPKPREVTLGIKATFPTKMVVVQPKALYLSQQSEKTIPFDVTINDFRDKKLNVTTVESTSEFVTADSVRPNAAKIIQTGFETQDVKAVRAKIHGTVSGSIPPGRHHALVAATTDDPDFAIVTVPMIINGPAYPQGTEPVVSPPMIQLTASHHPMAKRKASVQVVVPSDWEISHATAWPSEISVSYGEPRAFTETEVMIPVELELSKLPAHKILDGVVQLFANDGRNLVTIRTSLLWP